MPFRSWIFEVVRSIFYISTEQQKVVRCLLSTKPRFQFQYSVPHIPQHLLSTRNSRIPTQHTHSSSMRFLRAPLLTRNPIKRPIRRRRITDNHHLIPQIRPIPRGVTNALRSIHPNHHNLPLRPILALRTTAQNAHLFNLRPQPTRHERTPHILDEHGLVALGRCARVYGVGFRVHCRDGVRLVEDIVVLYVEHWPSFGAPRREEVLDVGDEVGC
jgi:hypothetical protein